MQTLMAHVCPSVEKTSWALIKKWKRQYQCTSKPMNKHWLICTWTANWSMSWWWIHTVKGCPIFTKKLLKTMPTPIPQEKSWKITHAPAGPHITSEQNTRTCIVREKVTCKDNTGGCKVIPSSPTLTTRQNSSTEKPCFPVENVHNYTYNEGALLPSETLTRRTYTRTVVPYRAGGTPTTYRPWENPVTEWQGTITLSDMRTTPHHPRQH